MIFEEESVTNLQFAIYSSILSIDCSILLSISNLHPSLIFLIKLFQKHICHKIRHEIGQITAKLSYLFNR